MVAATGFRSGRCSSRSANRAIGAIFSIVFALAAGPAMPQAGVALIKVDINVVAQGYRMSKLIGSSVVNDKNEKIGS